MRALSIDLDYIMEPCIGSYQEIGWDDHPMHRWKKYFDSVEENKINFSINEKNLYYCFDIFMKAILKCNNIVFSYNHDSILDDLIKYNDIDLINIDHHDDIIYASDIPDDAPNKDELELDSLHKNYEAISESHTIHEGNWISLLNIHKKINSYTFIGNSQSIDFTKSKKSFVKQNLPKFQYFTKDQYTFDDYNFDYIFICLSPQYIPPCYWHYFSMFIIAAKQITGKSFDYLNMPIRKFSSNYSYSEVYDIIETNFN